MEYIKNGEKVIAKTADGQKIVLHFSKESNSRVEELVINNLMSSFEARINQKI